MAHRYSNTNLPILLEVGDTVNFQVGPAKFLYRVNRQYLEHKVGRYGYNNAKIFGILDLFSDRGRIATMAYGYDNAGGGWPQYRSMDMVGATRLVLELLRLCISRTTGAPLVLAGVSTRDIVRKDADLFMGKKFQGEEIAMNPEMKKFYSLLTRRGILEKKTFKVLDQVGLGYLKAMFGGEPIQVKPLEPSVFPTPSRITW